MPERMDSTAHLSTIALGLVMLAIAPNAFSGKEDPPPIPDLTKPNMWKPTSPKLPNYYNLGPTGMMGIFKGPNKGDKIFVDRIEASDGSLWYAADPQRVCSDCGEDGDVELDIAADADLDEVVLADDGLDEEPYARRVLSPQNAWIMNSLMRDVIKRGTGRRALQLRRGDLAGKTGTTNDQQDAWFSGFNPKLVTTTWVGFDQLGPLGRRETGAGAALPMWIDFMRVALDDVIEDKIVRPDGLVTALIDRNTGEVTSAENPKRMFEIFREEHAPKSKPVLTAAPDSATAPGSDTQQTSPEQLF